jgi:short-subunit dehydrogenase
MRQTRWLVAGAVGTIGAYWLKQYLQPEHSPLIFENSVVLITGASSGIGRAYANAFARCGARIVLVARRAEVLETVRQEIEPYAAGILVVPTDVTDLDQLRALVDTTLAQFGRIDVLINNAGVANGGPLQSLSLESIRKTIEVNLIAAISLTHLCLPSMLAQRSGKIVNIASSAGVVASPYYGAYVPSKHGLVGFSNALRRELEGTGVEVISVMPSWTYSEMVNPEMQRALLANGAVIDTPEHVADFTIDGLLKGKQNIYFGGSRMRFGIWADRYFPALLSFVLRANMTADYVMIAQVFDHSNAKPSDSHPL